MTATLDSAVSFLFVPGLAEGRLREGLASQAHAIVADWEDTVPADEKPAARDTTRELFSLPTDVLKLVRINAPGTAAFELDSVGLGKLNVDGIVVPKSDPESLEVVVALGLPVIALIETGRGVHLAYETATARGVVGLAIGPGDLARDLKMELRPDGASLLYTRSKLVVDSAAAARRPPIDAPSMSTGDQFRADVQYARSLGLGGKLCLSVAQAEVINEVYGQSGLREIASAAADSTESSVVAPRPTESVSPTG